jgi:NADH:ubiquinone oxidoreductase subunit E
MLFVQICVGSSCHLKGSAEIVELFENALAEYHIEDDEVALSGSFCIGKCNRVGVTVQVNDDVHVGVTTENFREFFKKNILDVVLAERK